jgi:single-strand DNA-binding protein
LATTESTRDKKGNVIPQTEWHNIVLWRGLAELAAKYLHKGSLVHIQGSLKTRSWEDKDKNRRFMTEIIGSQLLILDKKTQGDRPEHSEEGIHPTDSGLADLENELPF